MPKSEPKKSSRSTREKQTAEEIGTLEAFQVLARQRWIILFFSVLGLAAGITYAVKAEVWYTSNARVLINDKSAGLANTTTGEMVDEDLLANHIELLRSRKIVGEALEANDMMQLDSIMPHLREDEDAIDFVIDRLEVVKGGSGAAKTARTLNISLSHTNPEDSEQILTAVLTTYRAYLDQQVSEMMDSAMRKINEAKGEVDTDLKAAELAYLNHRKDAPLLFQGEGSSNIYQDKYRRLQDELIDLEIQESTITTRLNRVQETLANMSDAAPTSVSDNMDKLALIDSESLERLGLFAGLQMSASNSAEFKATMPAKVEEARTKFAYLLKLNSDKQRLEAKFGPNHPDVQEVEDEIQLVRKFIDESAQESETTSPFGEGSINPEALLKAYVGFLNHDLATLEERKVELKVLSADAEQSARNLIEFELSDVVLRKEVERNEALFDGVVQQLRDVDIASGLKGYLYELLEVPRLGKQSWPKLPLCGLGGLLLGLFGGLSLAVVNDIRDGRFRSAAEVDEAIGLPSLGRVGKLNTMRSGVKGLIAGELSPNAEAFRLGRTLMLPQVRSGELKTLCVTSPMQGDGKSTVTSNLAASFSQVGLSVLVIDGDLRRPTVHRYFSVVPEDGLADILTTDIDPQDVIKETEVENVSVITAGASTATPAELLQSERLDGLIESMKEKFDLVIVDLPPVLAVSDPVVLAPRLDATVIVVRAATARRDEVLNSIRRLTSAGAEVVGCVLNTYGSGKKFSTSGGYYGYYESGYSRPSGEVRAARAAKPSEVS